MGQDGDRQEHVDAERKRNRGSWQRHRTVGALAQQEVARRQCQGAGADEVSVDTLRGAEKIAAKRKVVTPRGSLVKDPAVWKQLARMPEHLWSQIPEKPDRDPPLVLEGPHDATQPFHEDWTKVPGSNKDPAAWQEELKLRDVRNSMIKRALLAGRTVFYPSTGNSMWPMVQSNDFCLFHPIQAVTAEDESTIVKPESPIAVGDVVFCQVRPTGQYYAHFVRQISMDWDKGSVPKSKYWIGGLYRAVNGHAYRDDIFGILKRVFVETNGVYRQRPHPLDFVTARGRRQTLYNTVVPLVQHNEWCPIAQHYCEAYVCPDMQPPGWDDDA